MFFNVLGDIATFLSVAVSLLYLLCFVNQKSAYRVFCIYLLVVGFIELKSYYLGRGGCYTTNLYLSHYYFGLQFILLSLFYSILLDRKWILWVIPLVLAVIVYQFIEDPELYDRYNPWGIVLTTLPLVVYGTMYMLKGINKKIEFTVINVSLLAYLLTTLFIFASSNLVADLNITKATKQIINHINKVLYLVFLGMVIYEWFKNYNCLKVNLDEKT